MSEKQTRKELIIDPAIEHQIINHMALLLANTDLDALNTTLVGVSSDYSSIAWQVLRHHLSRDGEICSGFCVDVPYPDEPWTETTTENILRAFNDAALKQNIVLVEAGVIRGSNYTRLCKLLSEGFPSHKLITSTLFENVHSKFKSDFVCRYYDDSKYDLTFWWEKFNNHWIADRDGKGNVQKVTFWHGGDYA